MHRLDLTDDVKGQVISELFFNGNDWVIKLENGTAIKLELEMKYIKAVAHVNENCIQLKIEKEESE